MQVESVSVLIGTVTESISLEKTVEEVLRLPRESFIKEILIAYPAERVSQDCMASLNKIMKSGPHDGIVIRVIPQKELKMGFFTDLINLAEGTHCVPFPSDGAMPVSLIYRMIELEKRNPEAIVSSSRWLPESSIHGYNGFKLFVNRLAQSYLRILYRTKLTDLTNAVQITPTHLMKKIRWTENGFARGMEMVLKPLRLGVRFLEVPTDYTGRIEGQSSNSSLEFLSYIIPSVKIRFMSKDRILKDDSAPSVYV